VEKNGSEVFLSRENDESKYGLDIY